MPPALLMLLIDDDEAVARYMVPFLARHGVAVTVARCGVDGLAAVEGAKAGGGFDLVVLDQKLPDVDGAEVLHRLRRGGAAVPVLVLTAFPTFETALAAGRLGAVAYKQKPLVGAELIASIRDSVGIRASAPCESTAADAAALLKQIAGALLDSRSATISLQPSEGTSALQPRIAEAIVAARTFPEFLALAEALRSLVGGTPYGDSGGALSLVTLHLGRGDGESDWLRAFAATIEDAGVEWAKLSPAAVASLLGLTDAALLRKIAACDLESFWALRRSVVIRRCLHFLGGSREHVRQIGFQAGFKTHSQFVRACRAAIGVTPTLFRELVAEQRSQG